MQASPGQEPRQTWACACGSQNLRDLLYCLSWDTGDLGFQKVHLSSMIYRKEVKISVKSAGEWV